MRQFVMMMLISLAPGGLLAQDRVASWPGGGLEWGAHAVGFRAAFLYDYSRTYQVKEEAQDRAGERNARPMPLAIWYPAVADPETSKMTYREYVHLISQEEASGELGDEARAQEESDLTGMARALGASAEKLEQILASRTGAVRDGTRAKGRFPVVVYAPSFGSYSFENDVLCEVLASHGYVVVASSSKGMHSADMTMDFEGIEAQTRDMEFAIAFLHDFPHADPTRIAAVGFSWGGLCAVVLALRNHNVKAVVTLDGAIHNNNTYDLMKYSYFHGSQLRAALMQIRPRSRGPDGKTSTPTWDVHRFAKEARYVDTFLLQFEELVHWNHSSSFNKLFFLANEDREKLPVKDFDLGEIDSGYTLIVGYCRRFLDAYLKDDAKSHAYLKRTPEENRAPAGRLAVSRHAAVARPPSEEVFLAMIREQGVKAALEVYEKVAAEDPDYKLFTAAAMGVLGRELFDAGALDEATAVVELNVRTYPEQYRVYFGLGNVYAHAGRYEEAVAAFKKALELKPDSSYAKQRLEELAFTAFSGPYFGLESPGAKPRLFLPGLVTTTDIDGCVAFLAGGRVCVFSSWERGTQTTYEKDGRWTEPKKAPWQNERGLTDFTAGADGKTLYFQSSRLTSPDDPRRETNTWTVDWTDAGWSEARVLPEPPNDSERHEGYPSVARDGTLYFFTSYADRSRVGEIFRSRRVDGRYQRAEPFAEPINSSYHEVDPVVAPDGSYLLFGSGRPGGRSLGELYVSFRRPDGTWTPPIYAGGHLEPPVIPVRMVITPDGQYLFYGSEPATDVDRGADVDSPTRDRYGDTDVYWVGTGFLDELRDRVVGKTSAAALVVAEYDQHELAAAMARLETLRDRDDTYLELSELLIFCAELIDGGRLGEAERFYEALLGTLSEEFRIKLGYANALIMNRQTAEGLERLREVWSQWPEEKSESPLGLLIYQLSAKSRSEDELAVLRFITEEFPASEHAQLDLAAALERSGDVGGAIEHCRRALELDPANREAAEMLARLEQP